jgi:hypothetical protein
MPIELLKGLAEYFNKKKKQWDDKRDKRLAEVKQNTINELERSYSDAEVKRYNWEVEVNSNFWLGGDYTEKDIKLRLLYNRARLFSQEELEYYVNKINEKEKTKNK